MSVLERVKLEINRRIAEHTQEYNKLVDLRHHKDFPSFSKQILEGRKRNLKNLYKGRLTYEQVLILIEEEEEKLT